MAYRKSRGKLRGKTQPAVMQMTFELPASSAAYIDLALAASIANRRGYRQQDTNWVVGQFELFNPSAASNGTVTVQKLPETWVLDNAYTKTKALWEKMNDQVLDHEDGIQGKYADFKIAMDEAMLGESIQDNTTPAGKILTPQDGNGNFTLANFQGAGVAPLADWNFSQLTIPNDGGVPGATQNYYIHAVGPDAVGSKGMIAGYALSRSRPLSPDPNAPTIGGWMNDLFDDGEQLDELREVIQDDNDRVPYANGGPATSQNWYPGGTQEQPTLQIHSLCNFTTTTVSQKNSIMGGMFRNGLMKITNQVSNPVVLIIHMVPGSHRGYMVEEC